MYNQTTKKNMESKYFKAQEFVSPKIYDIFGELSWNFISPVMVEAANFIRDKAGVMVLINGVNYQYSGYREYDCPIGAKYSEHKFGRAIDIKLKYMTGRDIFNFVMKFEDELIAIGVTRIEDPEYTKTWLHLDCKPGGLVNGRIHVFKP